MLDLDENIILSDDECKCRSCSAILFMFIFGKYIPITQKDYDELFPTIFPSYLPTYSSRYSPFKLKKLE